MVRRSWLAVSLAIAAASPGYAQTATYNFETQSVTSGLTTLAMTDSGLTLTLTRPGATFGIANQSGNTGLGFPAAWGSRTLSPFENNADSAFLLNFSSALSGFSIEYGDYGADVDTISVIGYSGADGTGSQVFSFLTSLPFTDSTFHTGFVSTSGNPTPALSVRVSGGSSSFPNSLYFDNITATVFASVPEPSTWAMMLLGFFGIGMAVRRKRLQLAPAA